MDPEKPDAELRIKLDPKFHNRIAMIKNTGMKIFDKGNFPQITIFSGMLILKTKEVNGYFKKMENPAHDGWMLDRIKNDPTAKSKYDRMFSQVRDVIKSLAKDNTPESLDVVGLGEYLPDDISEGNDNNQKEGINDEYSEKIEIKEKIQLPNIDNFIQETGGDDYQSPTGVADEDGNFDANYGTGIKNNSNGGEISTNNASPGEGKLLISKENIVKSIKKRCIYNEGIYSLIIDSPEEMKNCKVVVQYAGEQTNFNPIVINAYRDRRMFGRTPLNHEDNKIEIGKVVKGEKAKIYFTLNDTNDWSLEVNVYEN